MIIKFKNLGKLLKTVSDVTMFDELPILLSTGGTKYNQATKSYVKWRLCTLGPISPTPDAHKRLKAWRNTKDRDFEVVE